VVKFRVFDAHENSIFTGLDTFNNSVKIKSFDLQVCKASLDSLIDFLKKVRVAMSKKRGR